MRKNYFPYTFLDISHNKPIPHFLEKIVYSTICCTENKKLFSSGFPGGSEVKASVCNSGDLGLIPGSGRYPGEGNGNPLQYSCLENPMDGGDWWATVHGVTKSQTRLSDFTFTSFLFFPWYLLWPSYSVITHVRPCALNTISLLSVSTTQILLLIKKDKKGSHSVVSDSLQPHGLYSLPGSSVHGIFQARVLEWVAISFQLKCHLLPWTLQNFPVLIDYSINSKLYYQKTIFNTHSFIRQYVWYWASQVVLVLKNPFANARELRDMGFDPWVGKIPWRRAQQATPVFLPRESHG